MMLSKILPLFASAALVSLAVGCTAGTGDASTDDTTLSESRRGRGSDDGYYGTSSSSSGASSSSSSSSGTATGAATVPVNADGTCPTGYELELEHGATFCKLHGTSSSSSSSSSSGSSSGATTGAATVPVNADGTCPAGYELELEHGAAFCKLHGRRGGRR